MVIAIFLPAVRALSCLFLAIFAPLTESLLIKQVDGLATIRPLRDPDVHLKPGRNPLPLTLRRIWLTPSAMADTHSSDTESCGTTSCVTDSAMALDGLDWMISVILIVTVFIATLTLNLQT